MSTMTQTEQTVRTYAAYIQATPEEVWQALTDPEWSERYGYRGRVHYELQPGGAYTAEPSEAMRAHGASGVVVEGEVIAADAPRRLEQTWHALFSPETSAEPPTRLTFELEELQPGITRVDITHDATGAPLTDGFTSGAQREYGGGWPWVLSDLKTLLETGKALEDEG